MIKVKVLIPFIGPDGTPHGEGEILEVPEHAVAALGDFAEAITTGIVMKSLQVEQHMQQQSTDYITFCLQHENTYVDGHCPIKHDRRDPLTGCLWWQQQRARR